MKLRSVLLVAATLCYPLLIYLLLNRHGGYGVRALALPLAVIAVLRVVLERDWWWGGALAVLAAVTAFTGYSLPAKLYPVAVNLGFLAVFGQSLRKPPSFVERIARLAEPDLPPQGVLYTRQVTQAWCVFFAANAAVAGWLAVAGSTQAWALYTGGIAYVLAGVLFAAEFLLRQRVRRQWGHV